MMARWPPPSSHSPQTLFLHKLHVSHTVCILLLKQADLYISCLQTSNNYYNKYAFRENLVRSSNIQSSIRLFTFSDIFYMFPIILFTVMTDGSLVQDPVPDFEASRLLLPPSSISASADVEGALIRSLHLNLHLTQYDLNLKGFSNPISTLNTG